MFRLTHSWVQFFDNGIMMRHEGKGDFMHRYEQRDDTIVLDDGELIVELLDESTLVISETGNAKEAYIFDRVSPETRKVFLPDADTPSVNVILDLASGELLPAGEGVHQLTVFREMGKGDLAYDRALICIRGGKAKLLRAGKLTNLKIKGQIEDSTAYELPGTPCRLVVTTAEGDAYEVKVLSVEGDEAGIQIEYWKSAEAPAEFTGVVQVIHPDSAMKLSRLGKAVVMYADDHNGKMPATLQELKPYLDDDFKWLLDNVEYLGKGKSAADAPDTTVAYDKTLLEKLNGTNVLFLDAHVEFLKPEELERLGIITGKKTQAILG